MVDAGNVGRIDRKLIHPCINKINQFLFYYLYIYL